MPLYTEFLENSTHLDRLIHHLGLDVASSEVSKYCVVTTRFRNAEHAPVFFWFEMSTGEVLCVQITADFSVGIYDTDFIYTQYSVEEFHEELTNRYNVF